MFVALDKGFEQLRNLGAAPKALILQSPEGRRSFFMSCSKSEGIRDVWCVSMAPILIRNQRPFYRAWMDKYKGTAKITGSPTADRRAAIVDYFRNEATIMIATEAAAEGINLQFCSLIVNYDMPWNPQRIEQRIGRCHRYGQKFDVVVINFLNKGNCG